MAGKMEATYGAIVPGRVVRYRDDQGTLAGQTRVVQGRYEKDHSYVEVGESQESRRLNRVSEKDFWTTFRPVTLDEAWDKPEVEALAPISGEANVEPTGEEIAQSLREWWLDVASQEVEPLVAKMFEYGGVGRSNDLVEIGRKMVGLGVPDLKHGTAQDDAAAYAAELGIFFYVEGKMARWSAAIAEGRPVSDDTLLDIGIYVRMVQRIRAVGGWPV